LTIASTGGSGVSPGDTETTGLDLNQPAGIRPQLHESCCHFSRIDGKYELFATSFRVFVFSLNTCSRQWRDVVIVLERQC